MTLVTCKMMTTAAWTTVPITLINCSSQSKCPNNILYPLQVLNTDHVQTIMKKIKTIMKKINCELGGICSDDCDLTFQPKLPLLDQARTLEGYTKSKHGTPLSCTKKLVCLLLVFVPLQETFCFLQVPLVGDGGGIDP